MRDAVVQAVREIVPGLGVTTLDDVLALAANEHYLAVVSTLRVDGTIQSSVVNAGSSLIRRLGGRHSPSSPTAG